MNAKEYLSQIRELDTLINRKNEELFNLKQFVCSITAASDKEAVKSSGSQDRLGDTVAKIVDLQNEINTDIDKIVNLKREIIKTIDSIGQANNDDGEPDESESEKVGEPDRADMVDLLYRRYLRFEKWEKIAYEMNYSIRWIYRLHGRALKIISEKLKVATKVH